MLSYNGNGDAQALKKLLDKDSLLEFWLIESGKILESQNFFHKRDISFLMAGVPIIFHYLFNSF